MEACGIFCSRTLKYSMQRSSNLTTGAQLSDSITADYATLAELQNCITNYQLGRGEKKGKKEERKEKEKEEEKKRGEEGETKKKKRRERKGERENSEEKTGRYIHDTAAER